MCYWFYFNVSSSILSLCSVKGRHKVLSQFEDFIFNLQLRLLRKRGYFHLLLSQPLLKRIKSHMRGG